MITDVFDKVAAATELSDITHKFGPDHLADNNKPPRMVWVPTSDVYEHGKVNVGSSYDRSRRALATQKAGVAIEVWGAATTASPTSKDHAAATELLVNRLLAYVHQQFFGAFTVEQGVWMQQDGQQLGQFGRKYTLSIRFQIPIYEPAGTVVPVVIEAEEQTPIVVSGTLGT